VHAFSFQSYEDTYLYLRNKLCIIVSNYGFLCLDVSLNNNYATVKPSLLKLTVAILFNLICTGFTIAYIHLAGSLYTI